MTIRTYYYGPFHDGWIIIVKLMCSNQLKFTKKDFSYDYGHYL